MRRHRAALATNTALLVAAGAVVAYAVSADGYREHRTELNDGGVWVTKSDKGYFGRMNKPIGRLDGAIYLEDDANLDVVQDGAAVVGINRRAGRAVALDPATLAVDDGSTASLPRGGQLQMRGGTLASVDPGTGATWASRFDAQLGDPVVGSVDQQAEPLAKVGEGASLTVTEGGTVLVASAEEDRLATWRPDGPDLADATTARLPDGAGEPTALTAVGETPVLLDQESGTLSVWDGPSASVAAGGVLQQPGPGADSVLVATDDGLSAVDLASGDVSTVVEGVSGEPAAPVRLGACVYGAWSGGTGFVAVVCGDSEPNITRLRGNATNLLFRVNRGEIVLNDTVSGTVWDVDSDNPFRIDNWDAFTNTRKVRKKDKQDEQQKTGDRRPPQAKPDDFGARPGRTSVLYPLDNDAAPEGRLLAIRGVDQPSLPGARVTISPDRQTLQLTLPADARGVATFDYFIDDGRNLKDQATVTVEVRGSGANTAPALRDGFEPRTWRVPASGSLEIPVLPDWRDPADSDPLMLESVRVLGGVPGAVARATTNGRVRLTAPGEGGNVQLEYAVSDGLSDPVSQVVQVAVQDAFDQETHSGVAEPDVVSGEVGKPIIVKPLANDLPGSDPSTPDARLEIGGRIPDQAGARVRTDLNSGVVRVDAKRAGTYLLDYQAAYGNAQMARGKIRVDVRQPPKNAEDPVATPDTLTLYGQAAATVDVLANDVDPAGGILVVQSARPDNEDQIDVSIVEGRWLRISARQGELTPQSQVVRYTISNGSSSGVTGEVLVTQRPRPADNTPVTAPDHAVVRAGAVVVHPVLDNDFSPSGDRLELVPEVDGTAGELPVEAPQDFTGDVGSAYAAGRTVRYVAPASLEERETFTVPYVAVNSTGETAPGTLTVVVVPDDSENSAPEPPTLEGRLVAGDSIHLKLPGGGLDPDGDPVVITGIASAPSLGRILEVGANSLEFQAYPETTGTEEFTYTVTDSRGAEATGIARVAVVEPGPPQPPVAVADSITVAPGSQVRLDVLANDQIGPADRVTVELVDPPAGVRLESEIGPLLLEAPDEAGADAVEVVYELSNGIDSSLTTARLETVEGFNNAPVVFDAFGRVDDSDAVTVDLLAEDETRAGAYDPDGSVDDLRVTRIHADEELYELDGNTVTVTRGDEPRVVPFRVEDADGGAATASLYVPATGTGRPYVKEGALVELESGGSTTFEIDEHVVNPSGGDLEITGSSRVWASPRTQLSGSASGTRVEVSARDGFRGPAAVLVEVVPADAVEDGEAAPEPTIVSIPVQVGSDQPTLECPTTPIEVAASDSVQVDIASVCFVWTLDPAEKFDLEYTTDWASGVEGVTASGDGGPVVTVAAAGGARAGSVAELTVRAGDSEPQTLQFRVVRAPSPSLMSFTVADMKPGSSREIDLARYLRAGVRDADPTILNVQRISGSSVQASSSGSVLRLRAPGGAEGRTELRIEMSDVSSGDPGPERRVSGRVSIEVLDVPTVPGSPVDVAIKDKAVKLSWAPSQPRGAPITHYEVALIDGSRAQKFRTNGGMFKVPTNGKSYSFKVRAHNKVGYSKWSSRSRSAVVDTAPGRVPWIRAQNPGDGTLTLTWGEPRTQTSDIEMYYLTWRGGKAQVPGGSRKYQVTGLDNNQLYEFSIRARNKTGTSEPRISDPFQSVGTPATPTGLSLVDQQTGADSTAVRLDWNGTLPEGPGPTTYTVRATSGNNSFTVPGCAGLTVTTCRHTDVRYDGRVWRYTVVAHNQPGNTSSPSSPVQFEAVGRPDPWGAWTWEATGKDNEVRLSYDVPVSRGQESTVSVLLNGAVVSSRTQRGPQSHLLRVPSNTEAHAVALQVCNEHAAQDGCSTSDTKHTQSYGPLRGHLAEVRAEVTGDFVKWVIVGSNNGNPAVIDYRLDGGPVQQVRLSGVGSFTHVTPGQKVGWEKKHSIEVWLGDDQPQGRDVANRSAQVTTGSPPPPDLGISRGASCNDDSEGSPCQSPAWNGGECTSDSCAFIVISSSGFISPHRCEIQRRSGPLDPFPNTLETLGPFNGNFTQQTPVYVGSGQVRLSCKSEPGHPRQEGTTAWLSW